MKQIKGFAVSWPDRGISHSAGKVKKWRRSYKCRGLDPTGKVKFQVRKPGSHRSWDGSDWFPPSTTIPGICGDNPVPYWLLYPLLKSKSRACAEARWPQIQKGRPISLPPGARLTLWLDMSEAMWSQVLVDTFKKTGCLHVSLPTLTLSFSLFKPNCSLDKKPELQGEAVIYSILFNGLSQAAGQEPESVVSCESEASWAFQLCRAPGNCSPVNTAWSRSPTQVNPVNSQDHKN